MPRPKIVATCVLPLGQIRTGRTALKKLFEPRTFNLSGGQFGWTNCATAIHRPRWRTRTGKILCVEGAQCCFHCRTDSNDAFFHTPPEKCDPKLTADGQSRPAHCRRTARMRSAIKFHSFHRRHCLICNAARFRACPVIPPHSILKTHWLARLDVTLFQ